MTKVTEPTHIVGYILQLIKRLSCIHELDFEENEVKCTKCGMVLPANRRKKERRS